MLCEKPIGLTAVEARELLSVRDRTGVQIQEAFMVRTHPQWVAARELVSQGRIGRVRAMSGFFSYFNDDAGNIRNVPEFGGGGLLDIGCYLIHTARFILGREPHRVAGAIELDPSSNVDRVASLLLDFGDAHVTGTCSTQLAPYQRVQIFGTTGRVDVQIPFNAPPDAPCQLLVGQDAAAPEVLTVEICNQYTIQGDLFSKALIDGTPPPLPLEDAVNNMECLDAVVRSARSGRWETPHTIPLTA